VDKVLEQEIRKLVAEEVEKQTQETMIEFINDLEGACAKARSFFSERKNAGVVPEQTFTILSWEQQKGERLGIYEIATKKANLPEKWQHAFSILKANNSTIAARLREPGYGFSYWIYNDTIFRQKFESKDQK
jgi:hypothetical protein